jgi:ComF family protein
LGLGEKLAQPLIKLLLANNWEIDLITAVPLDAARQRDRGYNQSLCLARPLAWKTGLPIVSSTIKRIKKTKSQVGLSLEDRKINVAGAFSAEPKLVYGKSILIIDDVVTTGSTINSCAEALMKAEALRVYGLTLARSMRL